MKKNHSVEVHIFYSNEKLDFDISITAANQKNTLFSSRCFVISKEIFQHFHRLKFTRIMTN